MMASGNSTSSLAIISFGLVVIYLVDVKLTISPFFIIPFAKGEFFSALCVVGDFLLLETGGYLLLATIQK